VARSPTEGLVLRAVDPKPLVSHVVASYLLYFVDEYR
jgi:hypothetical protein